MFKKWHWKTTLFGIGAIFTGVNLILSGHVPEGVTSILSGLGLTAAKDFDK